MCSRWSSYLISACKEFRYAACGQRLWWLKCCGHGDALLSCQVEQLKEELTQSQSEKEELRQRANELQREVSAVRDTPVCSSFLPFLVSVCLPGRLMANGCCLSWLPVESQYFYCVFRQQWATITLKCRSLEAAGTDTVLSSVAVDSDSCFSPSEHFKLRNQLGCATECESLTCLSFFLHEVSFTVWFW